MIKDKFTYTVKPEDEEYKVKDILRHNFTFSSRLRTKIKKNELVYLNGEKTQGWITPKAGDIISVALPEERSDFEPEDIKITPVYEDEDLLLINKQPGVVVHPTHGQPVHTIANGLMKYLNDTGQSFKIRFVNRLDRDTSGILVIAKNAFVQEELTKQMKANAVKKYYTAILCGIMEDDHGTVDMPIGRPDPDRIERGILSEEKGGYASITHYRVLGRYEKELVQLDRSLTIENGYVEGTYKSFSEEEKLALQKKGLVSECRGYTVAELLLETGRTHQIRVHMGYLGHNVAGDTLYGGVLCDKCEDGMYKAISERQLLHARRICFTHPVTKKYMEVEAPLPEDFDI